jgi:hypothetical protein
MEEYVETFQELIQRSPFMMCAPPPPKKKESFLQKLSTLFIGRPEHVKVSAKFVPFNQMSRTF